MYPKLFIENFWLGEQENKLFVCMPFGDSFDGKFEDIIKPVGEKLFEKAERSDKSYAGNDISYKINDGIANSKMLLFDLSNDPKSKGQVNGNVLYELGIARTIREPEEMLIIREGTIEGVPSNIRGSVNINLCNNLAANWLLDRLKNNLNEQETRKNKLLEIAKNSMEPAGFGLMDKYYKEKQIFDGNLFDRERLAALRLIDLGVLRGLPAVRGEQCERLEYSYCWTPFGQAFKKYLELDKRPRN